MLLFHALFFLLMGQDVQYVLESSARCTSSFVVPISTCDRPLQ